MSSAEQTITVAQAAWLVGLTPETIRAWINSGKLLAEKVKVAGKPLSFMIRLDDLVNQPDVLVDEERLRQLGPPEMAARFEKRLLELERRMAASEERDARNDERIKELNRQIEVLQAVAASLSAPPQTAAALLPPKLARVRAALTPTADAALDDYLPERYPNQQARGRFLENHGWSRTVTGGAEWKEQCPWGPPEAVLRWALERDARIGWRATTRNRSIHPCGVPECPCHQLFASGGEQGHEQEDSGER